MDKNNKARYVKIVNFNSVNDIPNVEDSINQTVEHLRENGGKVVSVQINNFGISPMNLMYNIIYEADAPIK